MRRHNIPSDLEKIEKKYSYYASCLCAMSNTHSLELPLSRTYFHGSKCVRAMEVLLYLENCKHAVLDIRNRVPL